MTAARQATRLDARHRLGRRVRLQARRQRVQLKAAETVLLQYVQPQTDLRQHVAA